MKLYKIKIRTYKKGCVNYVVANNPDEAYKILRKYLDEKNYFFSSERELDNIKLIAEEGDYPDCEVQLFIVARKIEGEKKEDEKMKIAEKIIE